MKILYLFLIWCGVLSLAAILLYGVDKRRAKRHQWRIREAVLLGVSFLGGAVGALAAMNLFRHKTKHWYFWAVGLLGLAWQVALAALLAYRGI